MQPYVTPPALVGLGLPLAFTGLALVSALLVRQIVPPGWQALRPGFGHWLAALGCAGFSALVAWVYLFVGSARRDAEFQMNVAFFLSIAFGLGAVYSGWRIRAIKRENMRWRGSRIVRNDPEGQEQATDGGSALSWSRTWSGFYAMHLAGGSTLFIDPFASGSDAFMAASGPAEESGWFDEPRP